MSPSDEREFYEDAQEQREVIGYCTYCKCEVYSDEKNVQEDGKLFHKECYLLENQGQEPGIYDE
jgi:hypothetical protein